MATPIDLLDALKPVLEEYLAQKATVEGQITQQGTIPRYFCYRCPRRSILEVHKLDEEEKAAVGHFVDWMDDNSVHDASSDGKNLRFISSIGEIEGIAGISPSLVASGREPWYQYEIPTSELREKSFFSVLKNEFHQVATCTHVDKQTLAKTFPIILTTTSRYPPTSGKTVREVLKKPERKELRLFCPECYSRIESIGCEDGITRQRGFVFHYFCPLKDLLLQNLLDKHKITFIAPKLETHSFGYGRHTTLYLSDLQTLVTDEKGAEEQVKKLNPECILAFGTRKDLFDYTRLDAHIIIFDDSAEASQRYFIFDKNKKIENSLENVIRAVVDRLDVYAEGIRGKEHVRLVGAFEKIGQDLGFLTQQELRLKGALFDMAWLDRQGIVQVAIEVEDAASTWKKDIISTWEAQPRLAIILTHDKTDKKIRDLTQYVLLQYMPHKLLFVNYELKRAYLVEKQDLLKCYDLEKKAEVPKSEIFEF